jgi:hypothetical protein
MNYKGKTTFHITLVLDLVTYYCLLHKLLICYNEIDVEKIFDLLQEKTVLAHEDVIQDGVTIIKRRENSCELQ